MKTFLRPLSACLTIIATALGPLIAPRAQPSSVYLPMVVMPPAVLAFAVTSRGAMNEDIAVANVDGSNLSLLTHTAPGEYAHAPTYAPDATQIAFVFETGTTSSVCRMNADGSAVATLATISAPAPPTYNIANHPTWSPDGSQIAFAAQRSGQTEIDIMHADGSNLHRLVSDGWQAAWAPDGTQIAFISRRDGNAEIYTIAPDGTNLTRLTTTAFYEETPSWAPDGRQLAFTRDGVLGIFMMNADGSAQRQILNLDHHATAVSWSPDGRRLAYTGYGPLYEVFVGIVNIDGTNAMRLQIIQWAGDPAWQP